MKRARIRLRFAPLAAAVAIVTSSCIVMVSFDDYERAPSDASMGGGISGTAGIGGVAGTVSGGSAGFSVGGVAGVVGCADASVADGTSCSGKFACGNAKWFQEFTTGTFDGDPRPRNMSLGDSGLVVAARFQNAVDLDADGGSDVLSLGGYQAFVAAFDSTLQPTTVATITSDSDFAISDVVSAGSSTYLSGWCWTTMTYHPPTQADIPFGCSGESAFVIELTTDLESSPSSVVYKSASDSTYADSIAATATNGLLIAGSAVGDVSEPLNLQSMGGGNDIVFAYRTAPNPVFGWKHNYGDSTQNTLGVRTASFGSYAFLTGRFSGAVSFDPNAPSKTIPGYDSLFIAAYELSSGTLTSQRTWGGQNGAYAVAADSNGITIAGFIGQAANFGGGLVTPDEIDCLAARFRLGSEIEHVYSRDFGGPGTDECPAVAVAANGNALIGGYVQSEVSIGGYHVGRNTDGATTTTGFVAELDPCGQVLWARDFPTSPGKESKILDVAYADSTDYYVYGTFIGSVDLGGTPLTDANQASFLAKYAL